ncbi:hypothetical protein HER10_EVM0002197 [Colletotrichum scovillei]|uniref:uncharacterized protein n=1 Tax=Colletotrichum scovillei TaxID=1209932 RepID=UPI0015C31E06|nr:uncharacterized protein HER10_EVM0002197 [Colletotrichum scovillei]KAF4785060.1 hypothetical protein HER10_EVM0002197 [Colletotrichum scovillei]
MDAGMQIYHEWSFEEKDGSPPHLLHFCVFEGLGFAVEEILKTNPEYVNAKSGNGATALQVAALHGHAEVVVLLLNKGADLHAKDGRRGTALQAASFNGHEDVVEILLDKGADPNIQGGRLDTPLQAAALNGHRGIGELLLDRGADCNAQGGEYGTALQAASYKGHDGVANILIGKGADLNAQGGKFGTALVAAAASGHKTIVRLLIKKGADANAQASIPCKTALWVAALNLHEEIVRILLDEGAVANLSSIGAEILAHYWETVIEVLRVRGVEIGEKGWQASWRSKMISHQTILMLLGKMFVADTVAYFSNVLVPASGEGHLDIAQALIELGAKTNATDAHGMSALSLAAANGHENIVKLLLHHEALSFIKVDYKCHPLYTASCGNQVKIIKLMPLNDIGADTVYESIVSALQCDCFGAAEELLKHFSPRSTRRVNIPQNILQYALQQACCHRSHRLVKMLLESGASANEVDKNGASLLQNPYRNSRPVIADLLLQHSARGSTQKFAIDPLFIRQCERFFLSSVAGVAAVYKRREDYLAYNVSVKIEEGGKVSVHVS